MKKSTRILFLGTGNAFNTDGRGSQSIWIEPAGRPAFLVDFGPTALAALACAEADLDRVAAVFFTHLHGDHIAGWPFLLLHAAFVSRRRKALHVFGARGTKRRLQVLADCCYEELISGKKLAFRLEHHEIPVRRANGRDAAGLLRYDAVPLDHHPTSLGFRFHLPGVTIAVSGDTRWCPALEELSRGADLLILECTCLEKPDYAHVSLEEVRAGIRRLEAKRVVLVHLPDAVARALAKRPIRGVEAADDGMILEV
jgi:ribonuclease BN (tRNA processing enzyme)